MQKHISIRVTGKVQGVFFRASTRDVAIQFGLKGFVSNEADGSVYVEAEGNENVLKEFTEWCKKGPRLAHVDRLELRDGEWVGFTDFIIKH